MRCRNCATRDDDGRIVEFGHHDTVAEARECKGVPNPREVNRQQTFVKNAIDVGEFTEAHFTKEGLAHIADIFDLSSSGTKAKIAQTIREHLTEMK